MIVLAAAFAALIGLSPGLLGGGGSILTVPVLGFGAKEATAAGVLRARGFRDVLNLTGGYREWEGAGLPVGRGEPAAVPAYAGRRGAGAPLPRPGAPIHPPGGDPTRSWRPIP